MKDSVSNKGADRRLASSFCLISDRNLECSGTNIVQNFKLTKIGIDNHHDLDKWNSYKGTNPLSFIGVRQFYGQKLA